MLTEIKEISRSCYYQLIEKNNTHLKKQGENSAMGKLQQTLLITTVTGLKQETYEVAKVINKNAGTNLLHTWAKEAYFFFFRLLLFVLSVFF